MRDGAWGVISLLQFVRMHVVKEFMRSPVYGTGGFGATVIMLFSFLISRALLDIFSFVNLQALNIVSYSYL